MLLLPVDRVGGRQVGEWASEVPLRIRGSVAARSHNYAETMHIRLPVAAKQGLETYREKASVLQAASPRRAPAFFALSRPRRKITSV